jgi:juvenile hormone epoxide hydrolase
MWMFVFVTFVLHQGASKPGMGVAQVAVVMKNLMDRLGHKKFVVQGGDWGALIGNHMSVLYPEAVYGFHTNMPAVQSPLSMIMILVGSLFPSLVMEKDQIAYMYPLSEKFAYIIEEMGYFHIQATKPDTVGNSQNSKH